MFSGRAGSGVIVARLPDGSWSAPSAIVTAGAGVGGQIGAEITDFVFILNNKAAVDSFAQFGSITLGANVSVAAGPLGRNAEGAGTASLRSASAVFAYSKTKGLFAGVSLEGSAIVERRDANRKFYGENCKARNILSGTVEPPPACDSLLRVLESRVFNNLLPFDDDEFYNDDYYDDIPSEFSDSTSAASGRSRRRNPPRASSRRYSDDYDDYSDDDYDDYGYNRARRGGGRSGGSNTAGVRTNSARLNSSRNRDRASSRGGAASWEDDIYDTGVSSRRNNDVDDLSNRFNSARISPGRPPASSKPNFGGAAPKTNASQAIALYSFKGEQSGDLAFKKGDVIDILKKTGTTDDWWTGRNNGATGIFPANYVELI